VYIKMIIWVEDVRAELGDKLLGGEGIIVRPR
jgi:hypothetical protein